MGKLSYKEDDIVKIELPFLKMAEESLGSNSPLNTLILVYINKRNEILYANIKFKAVLGKQYSKFMNQGLEYWYSMIPQTHKSDVENKILSFSESPNQHKIQLNYPVLGNNSDYLHLQHSMYRCLFHNLEFMVSLISIHPRKIKTDYFFKPKLDYISSSTPRAVQISKREEEVLELIANGYSSKEIAAKLFISNHTAISHRKKLLEKFKAKNTAHLIKTAMDDAHL